MLIDYVLAQSSIVLRVKLRNSSVSTGAGLTGLTSASSGLIISTAADNEATATTYTVAGSTIESITTLGTFAAPTATKCRFKEFDATNHKGVYELQIADARFAVSSAKSVVISISGATNLAECDVCIPLRSVNPYDSVRFGLTALPNATAGASGGLPLGDASGRVDLGKILGTAAATPATAGVLDVNAKNVNNVSTSSVTTINANVGTTQPINFTGTAGSALAKSDVVDIAGAAVSTSTAQLGVNVVNIAGTASAGTAGYVGLDWGHITAPTTTVALTGTTIGTLTTYTGNTVQTGDAYARIGAAGAGLTALGDTRIANLDATVTSRLAPTVAARTLDVSATGEAGVDWANVGSPTTTVALSGTTVGTLTTYTGNTVQTGDAYARIGAAGAGLTALGDTRIANLDAAVTSRLAPTVSGRTLDVTAGGEAGIDWANIGSPTTTVVLSGTTVGTLTTYTGNTVQTGDSYARIGAAGAGLTAVVLATAPPTAAAIAIATRDVSNTSPATSSLGAAVNSAASAGDPWSTPLPGSYATGTAGKIVGTNLAGALSGTLGDQSAGSVDAVVLPSGPAANGILAGSRLRITSGVAQYQERTIIVWDGTGKIATIDEPFSGGLPASGDTFEVRYDHSHQILSGNVLATGQVSSFQAGALAQLFTLDSGQAYADAVDGSPVKEIATHVGAVASVTGNVGGNVVGTVASVVAKTGYSLAATGLDAISVADPGAPASHTTFPKMMVAVWRALWKKNTMTATQAKRYADDGTTANGTATVSDDGTTQTQGTFS